MQNYSLGTQDHLSLDSDVSVNRVLLTLNWRSNTTIIVYPKDGASSYCHSHYIVPIIFTTYGIGWGR